MMSHDLTLKVARAIADYLGSGYDRAFEDEREWMDARGTRDDGEYGDIDAPYRCEYRDAARAAIEIAAREIEAENERLRGALRAILACPNIAHRDPPPWHDAETEEAVARARSLLPDGGRES